MKAEEIIRRRMHGLRLWGPHLDKPEEVVATLGAMQAQEYAYAKWSIGQRTKDCTEPDVEEAISAGRILRTHVLRPTWHFVAPRDIRWMLALTGPRIQKQNAGPYEREELDAKTLARSDRTIAKALNDGAHLTRTEIADVLNRARLHALGQRLGFMLMHAELEAIICSGVRSGKHQTYALLDDRAPSALTLDRDTALAELTRRYFETRGPATARDMSWWSGLTITDCRNGIEMLGLELEPLESGGRTYWIAPSPLPRKPARPIVDLLQVYDETAVSYSESRDVLSPKPAEVLTRTIYGMHILLLDGRLAGRWARSVKKDGVTIEVSPLRKVNRGTLDNAVKRYRRFETLPVTLSRSPT